MQHTVETCPDDLDTLRTRLDAIAHAGARVISVIWQARRVDEDQSGAYDTSGSFVIVSEAGAASRLHEREIDATVVEELAVPIR